jgi:hypothetical protein
MFTILGFLLVTAIGWGLSRSKIESVRVSSAVSAQSRERPRFRLLSGSFNGDHASYTLQTPPEEKNFADDCIGCEQEVGNAVIFADFGCTNKSEYFFESNSKGKVVQKESISDGGGSVVGERRTIVFEDNEGQVVAARMFWIEGKDFWAVQAPTVELTKALKESREYEEVRKRVVEEMKAYKPIINANTVGKDRCAEFTQRRVSH